MFVGDLTAGSATKHIVDGLHKLEIQCLTDIDQIPIIKARYNILDGTGKIIRSGISDSKGWIKVNQIPEGEYRILFIDSWIVK